MLKPSFAVNKESAVVFVLLFYESIHDYDTILAKLSKRQFGCDSRSRSAGELADDTTHRAPPFTNLFTSSGARSAVLRGGVVAGECAIALECGAGTD